MLKINLFPLSFFVAGKITCTGQQIESPGRPARSHDAHQGSAPPCSRLGRRPGPPGCGAGPRRPVQPDREPEGAAHCPTPVTLVCAVLYGQTGPAHGAGPDDGSHRLPQQRHCCCGGRQFYECSSSLTAPVRRPDQQRREQPEACRWRCGGLAAGGLHIPHSCRTGWRRWLVHSCGCASGTDTWNYTGGGVSVETAVPCTALDLATETADRNYIIEDCSITSIPVEFGLRSCDGAVCWLRFLTRPFIQRNLIANTTYSGITSQRESINVLH